MPSFVRRVKPGVDSVQRLGYDAKMFMFPLSVFVKSHFTTQRSILTFHPSLFVFSHFTVPSSSISFPFHGAPSGEPSPSGENPDAPRKVPSQGSLVPRPKGVGLAQANIKPCPKAVGHGNALGLAPPQGSLSSRPEGVGLEQALLMTESSHEGDGNDGRWHSERKDALRTERNAHETKLEMKPGIKVERDRDMNVFVSDCQQQRRREIKLKKFRMNKLSRERVSSQKALRKLKANKQTCCSRNHVLECVVEFCREKKKVSKPNRKKIRRDERKQSFRRHKNGKVVEFHMSKEDKRNYEKIQKNIQSHTRRSLSYILNKLEPKRELSSKKHNEQQGSIKSKCTDPATQNERGCTFDKKHIVLDSTRHAWKQTELRQCWLCDQEIGPMERVVECDSCNICYHVYCMGYSNVQCLLTNKAVSWMCRKCGRCNYSVSLLHDFGIPTDENIFEILLQDVTMEESSGAKWCIEGVSCIEDSRKNEIKDEKSIWLAGL